MSTKVKNPAIEPAVNAEPVKNLPKIPTAGLGVETEKTFNQLTLEERRAYFAKVEQKWLKKSNSIPGMHTKLTRDV